ncbi:dipeptidylpeptidase [Quaeritorhiza haematococci]|nr:dipeptidylpeptidase [Quaeritorhiza haematococci]
MEPGPICEKERILYLEVDESMVEMITIPRPGMESDVEVHRYPRVGKPNAVSEPKIVDFCPSHPLNHRHIKAKHRRLHGSFTLKALFPWLEYIVRMGWTPDGRSVWAQLLDRRQQHTALVRIPAELFMTDDEYDAILDCEGCQTQTTRLRGADDEEESHQGSEGIERANKETNTGHRDLKVNDECTEHRHGSYARPIRRFRDLPKVEVLHEENTKHWINVTDIICFVKSSRRKADETVFGTCAGEPLDQPATLGTTTQLIWSSEKTGFRHLYHFECDTHPHRGTSLLVQNQKDGDFGAGPSDTSNNTSSPPPPSYFLSIIPKRVRAITAGQWQVVDHPIWVDESKELVYFLGKRDTPLETHLYVSSYAQEHTVPVVWDDEENSRDKEEKQEDESGSGEANFSRRDQGSRDDQGVADSSDQGIERNDVGVVSAKPATNANTKLTVSRQSSFPSPPSAGKLEHCNIKRLTKLGYSHSVKLNDRATRFVTTFSNVSQRPVTEVYELRFGRSEEIDEGCEGCAFDADNSAYGCEGDGALGSGQTEGTQNDNTHHDGGPATTAEVQQSLPCTVCAKSFPEARLLTRIQPPMHLCSSQNATPDNNADIQTHPSPSSQDSVSSPSARRLPPQNHFSGHSNTSLPSCTPALDLLSPTSIPVPEMFSFHNQEGVLIHGMVYKPENIREGETYPTLLRVYGGPNVQVVTNDYKHPKFSRVFLALKFGFVVVMVDSRGSYDRGIAFESSIQHRMGSVELRDQIEALIYLATKWKGNRNRDESVDDYEKCEDTTTETWNQESGSNSEQSVDDGVPAESLKRRWAALKEDFRAGRWKSFMNPDKIAITGWSYGGYLSLMALAQYPQIFKMSLSGAPVTSWELYDTAYTERYMGLLQDNPEAYHRSGVLNWIENFPDNENRLLVVHGLIDENVHFKNTEVFVSALVKASKPHQVQVYPTERHGLRSANVIEHFETLMFWWLLSYL